MKNPSPLLFLDDGLPLQKAQARYAERRCRLAAALGQSAVFYAVGEDLNRGLPWAHAHLPIFQDPTFLWLTGITQPGAALVLAANGESHLYLPPKDPSKEFWEGERFGVGSAKAEAQVRGITGIGHLHPFDQLKTSDFDLASIEPVIWEQRLPMDPVDLKLLKRACAISAEAFEAALTQVKSCRSETELSGILNGEILRRTAFGNSFPTILAAGKNAAVLHYTRNDQPIRGNELILMDFGARWYGLHADVSRTVPASGRFNPLQRILYTIVLDAQTLVQSRVKPGVTVSDLNTACWTFINTALQTRFIAKGGQMTLPYTTQPHNVGHLLGRQVHDGDAIRKYRDTPLQAGWVITNEPGLYGHFSIEIDGVHYAQTIGIRIEDDLFITPTGCQNLTRACPKQIGDIERMMHE